MAFEIKRNDRRPYFRVQLTQNNDPADLTTAIAGSTVKLNRLAMTFVDRPTGIVQYAWAAGDTDTSGDYNIEVEVDRGGAEYETFPSTGYFTIKINDDLG